MKKAMYHDTQSLTTAQVFEQVREAQAEGKV